MGGVETGAIFQFYRYTPSLPAATTCLIIFGLLAALHTYQMLRTRTWVMIPLVIGTFCETVGYIGRILSNREAPNFTIAPFLVQGLLILWGPAWFAASIYMCFGRILRATGGQHLSLIRPSILTAIFVSSDYLGLALQGIGSGVQTAGTLNDYYTGGYIVIAGLAVLVASFSFFMVITTRFHRQIDPEVLNGKSWTSVHLPHHLWSLHAVSVLILLRSCCRLAEYAEGNAGWLITHEWFFYAFDAIPMFFVLLILSLVHPSQIKAVLHGGVYSRRVGLQYGYVSQSHKEPESFDSPTPSAAVA